MKKRRVIYGVVGSILLVLAAVVVTQFKVKKSLVTIPGPTVIISGEVIFKDYKKGPITIAAWSKRGPGPPDIAFMKIPRPGKYHLKVPANAGEIYVVAANFDPKTAGPEGAAEAAGGEYGESPLKVGSENIEGLDIVLHSPLKPLTGPTVTISGEVIFKDYKQGSIDIVARSEKHLGLPDIALVEIPGPGKYTLRAPANVGEIYVMAANLDPLTAGPKEAAEAPKGTYGENPLKVGAENIEGIDIVIYVPLKPLKPLTGPTVTISGKVIFKGYKKGPLTIFAQSRRGPGPADIAATKIPGPGRYSLKVPANAGDIYVVAADFDPKTAGPEETAVGAIGDYSRNRVKVGSEDLKGIDIVMYYSLRPLTGPTVTISGEVIFKDYKQGSIDIVARSKKGFDPPDIAETKIPEPGRYSLKVPANAGELYVEAANFDPLIAGLEETVKAAKGRCGENPLKVGAENIEGIDIVMYDPLKPLTGPTVAISGEVIFKDYKKGPITIVALSKRGSDPPDIAEVWITEPGRYNLRVPANIGDIYILAVNRDLRVAGPERVTEPPGGEYGKNPLRVGSKDIRGVDIVLINPGGREPPGVR